MGAGYTMYWRLGTQSKKIRVIMLRDVVMVSAFVCFGLSLAQHQGFQINKGNSSRVLTYRNTVAWK